jgi:hypothetical protein
MEIPVLAAGSFGEEKLDLATANRGQTIACAGLAGFDIRKRFRRKVAAKKSTTSQVAAMPGIPSAELARSFTGRRTRRIARL